MAHRVDPNVLPRYANPNAARTSVEEAIANVRDCLHRHGQAIDDSGLQRLLYNLAHDTDAYIQERRVKGALLRKPWRTLTAAARAAAGHGQEDDSEEDEHNDQEGADASNVVHLRAGDSRKRRRPDTAQARPRRRSKEPPKLLLTGDEWRPTQVVRTIQDELETDNGYGPDAVAAYVTINNFCRNILADVFRSDNLRLVDDLILEAASASDKIAAAAITQARVQAAAQQAEAVRQKDLATFIQGWGQAVCMEQTSGQGTARLFMMSDKVRLVQRWDRLVDTAGPQRASLEAMLLEQGIEGGRGRSLHDRLVAFVYRALGLKDAKAFSNTLYQWRPLADFVACFGPGVLVFLPRGLDKKAAALARPLAGDRDTLGLARGERSLPWLLRYVRDHHPKLADLCRSADECLVTPILTGAELVPTRATVLCQRGETDEMAKLPLEEKLRPLGQLATGPASSGILAPASPTTDGASDGDRDVDFEWERL